MELLSCLLSRGVPAGGAVTPLGNFYELADAERQGRSGAVVPRPGYFVPLAQAVNFGDEQAVKLLLDHGADPLEPSHFNGRSSIQLADNVQASRAIKQLLARHAELSMTARGF
jgi:ankyrin repeat protein